VHLPAEFCSLCFSRPLPHEHYIYVYALQHLKLHTLHERRCYLDTIFLIQVCSGSKSSPSRLVFEILLATLEASLCSVSALRVRLVLLLDALQLLMLFSGTLLYSKQEQFSLNIISNGKFMLKYCDMTTESRNSSL
jgi:hypothetical protein